MTTEHYQNLVIGSGEAGKYLAWTLAKQGQRTVMVERALVGGSCPNVACLPSKNIIYSAKVASLLGRAAEFGGATGPVKIEMTAVFRRKQKMVNGLIQMHRDRYVQSGAELRMGEARFTEPTAVRVTSNSCSER